MDTGRRSPRAPRAPALATGEASATIITNGYVIGSGTFGSGDSTVSDIRVGGNFGDPGTGSLEINGGSVLTTPGPRPDAWVAAETGSSGAVTVTGAGSTWHITGEHDGGPGDPDNGFGGGLSVGRGGDATLNVLAGGRVLIDAGGLDGRPTFNLGGSASLATGRAWVTVDGEGSIVSIDGNGASATIGRGGHATMTVRNGGALSVSGPGAFLAVSREGPPEGPNGARGWLDVLDGGTVTVDGGDGFSQLVIGRDPGSDGEVRVAGNSRLTIRGNEARLYVGRDSMPVHPRRLVLGAGARLRIVPAGACDPPPGRSPGSRCPRTKVDPGGKPIARLTRHSALRTRRRIDRSRTARRKRRARSWRCVVGHRECR